MRSMTESSTGSVYAYVLIIIHVSRLLRPQGNHQRCAVAYCTSDTTMVIMTTTTILTIYSTSTMMTNTDSDNTIQSMTIHPAEYLVPLVLHEV